MRLPLGAVLCLAFSLGCSRSAAPSARSAEQSAADVGCWQFSWPSTAPGPRLRPTVVQLSDSASASAGFRSARYPFPDTARYRPQDSLPWYRYLNQQNWRRLDGGALELLIYDQAGTVNWTILLHAPTDLGARLGTAQLRTDDGHPHAATDVRAEPTACQRAT